MAALALSPAPWWIVAILLTLALAVRAAVPRHRRRRPRARAVLRALLPSRIVRSRSGRLDIVAFLFSWLFAGIAFGWALLSSNGWAAAAERGLAGWPSLPFALPVPVAATVMTLSLFLSYEAAYWFNHWLSHRVGWLWAFHKVHHTAESLSLLTNFRVHPVDTILFYNMAAIANGLTAGLVHHLIGPAAMEVSVGGTNLLIFLSSITLSYLQHSHLWIPCRGRLGRWILSPAHHQLHHSTDPRHFNRNLGSTLAIFDRLAGTLLAPSARREALRFGIDGLDHDPHALGGALIRSFAEAAKALAPRALAARAPAKEPA